jgi:hypothetical protein
MILLWYPFSVSNWITYTAGANEDTSIVLKYSPELSKLNSSDDISLPSAESILNEIKVFTGSS